MADGKWISDLTRATPVADAARRVLVVRLEVVRDNLRLALREPDKDPEYVHQLRVGTRRAGAAVEIFSHCLPEKNFRAARRCLRRIRRAAGRARDWDVFLLELADWRPTRSDRNLPGLDFLFGYALGQRVEAQGHLEEACPDYPFDFERFLAETVAAVHKSHAYPEARTLVDLARPMLARLVQDLHEAAATDLDNYDNLHRVRIVGKRLRYAMEVFADCFEPAFREEIYPDIEEMQDILGRANDSHVGSQRLQALSARIQAGWPQDWKRFKAGIEGLARFHEKRLPKERQLFLDWWAQWTEDGGEAALTALLRSASPHPRLADVPRTAALALNSEPNLNPLPAAPEPGSDSEAG